MNRFYSMNHSSIDFVFKQTARDFVVDEIPLYEFSGEGEHLILHVRKKNLTTWEMIDKICVYLGIKAKEIGYAGLKDKNAMTKQYISVNKKYEKQMESFDNPDIKILSKTYHDNKIRTGHLKGNRFFIRLKKVNPTNAKKISLALKHIKEFGLPNFFGYQRFGNDGDNYILGEKVARGQAKERNPKVKKLLINSYQSHLFNLWLSRRLEISALINSFSVKELEPMLNLSKHTLEQMKEQTHPFKMIVGDVIEHYPHGRLFNFEGDQDDIKRFEEKKVSITGLLCGKKAWQAKDEARLIEKDYDEKIAADGARRYAWIFPENVEGEYKEEEAWYELHFSLPKGSYATVLIEEIAKREIKS
ncbi:tRNA pseudouridine(13) synthase TruD [Sulfurimonas sp. HSL-1716]|uniref:tRNA pseudouridine(13) synthase TruD n=1 Tax=Hydrocurvibacter sulfurireducens TaxID=3131937 RepID=UPI0031F84DD8